MMRSRHDVVLSEEQKIMRLYVEDEVYWSWSETIDMLQNSGLLKDD